MTKPKKTCAHRRARVHVHLILDAPMRRFHRLDAAAVVRGLQDGSIRIEGADWEASTIFCPTCNSYVMHGLARLSDVVKAYRAWAKAFVAMMAAPMDGAAAAEAERSARHALTAADPEHAAGLVEGAGGGRT